MNHCVLLHTFTFDEEFILDGDSNPTQDSSPQHHGFDSVIVITQIFKNKLHVKSTFALINGILFSPAHTEDAVFVRRQTPRKSSTDRGNSSLPCCLPTEAVNRQ